MDVDENGLGVAYVAGDADNDGLADVYEIAIDGNDNDGFVVNEGVTDPLDTATNTPSACLNVSCSGFNALCSQGQRLEALM